MTLSSLRQRISRPSEKLLSEFIVFAAAVFIAILLALQVGDNARAVTAMRQDNQAMRQDNQAKAVLSAVRNEAVGRAFGTVALSNFSGDNPLPTQAGLRPQFPGMNVEFALCSLQMLARARALAHREAVASGRVPSQASQARSECPACENA